MPLRGASCRECFVGDSRVAGPDIFKAETQGEAFLRRLFEKWASSALKLFVLFESFVDEIV